MLERESFEGITGGSKELVLELDPVKTQGVQEALQEVHGQQDTSCDGGKDGVSSEEHNSLEADGHLDVEHVDHDQIPEGLGQLHVSKRQGPQAEVRGSVGNAAQDILDRLNDLVDEEVSAGVHFVVAVFVIIVVVVVRVGVSALRQLCKFALVLAVLDQRLRDQHPRHAHKGHEQNDELDVRLQVGVVVSLVQSLGLVHNTRCERNVHERSDERRVVGTGVRGRAPLVENHEDHVAEEGDDKDELGNELVEECVPVLEENLVGALEANTENHVQHTERDRNLHLERIAEQNLIRRNLPDWIQTERIHADLLDRLCALVVDPLRRGEVGDTEGKRIVVDETIVHGKESHHTNHVASVYNHGKSFVEFGSHQALLGSDHVNACDEPAETVAHIAKHNGKGEWESDHGDDGGVGLLVLGHTIRVDDTLEGADVLVGLEVRRRGRPRLRAFVDGATAAFGAAGMANEVGHFLSSGGEDPTLADGNTGVADVELVERVVDAQLHVDADLPLRKAAREQFGGGFSLLAVVHLDVARVGDFFRSDTDFLVQLTLGLQVRGVVDAGAVGVADLAQLRLNFATGEHGNEDLLLFLFLSFGVDELDRLSRGAVRVRLLKNGGEAHEAVAASGAEDHLLEAEVLIVIDDTSHEVELDNVVLLVGGGGVSHKLVVVGVGVVQGLLQNVLVLQFAVVHLEQLLVVFGKVAQVALVLLHLLLEVAEARGRRHLARAAFLNELANERGRVRGGGDVDFKLGELVLEVTDDALERVALLHLVGVRALVRGLVLVQLQTQPRPTDGKKKTKKNRVSERRPTTSKLGMLGHSVERDPTALHSKIILQKGTYVSELNHTALSKLAEDLVDLRLWHDQRHVLHLGGAEPPHLGSEWGKKNSLPSSLCFLEQPRGGESHKYKRATSSLLHTGLDLAQNNDKIFTKRKKKKQRKKEATQRQGRHTNAHTAQKQGEKTEQKQNKKKRHTAPSEQRKRQRNEAEGNTDATSNEAHSHLRATTSDDVANRVPEPTHAYRVSESDARDTK